MYIYIHIYIPIVSIVVPFWGLPYRILIIYLVKPKKELQWRLWVYVCMHTYSDIYIRMHMYMYKCMCVYTFVSIHAYLHTHVYTYVDTHTYLSTHIHTYI